MLLTSIVKKFARASVLRRARKNPTCGRNAVRHCAVLLSMLSVYAFEKDCGLTQKWDARRFLAEEKFESGSSRRNARARGKRSVKKICRP
jgi:hypothetical protein